MLSISTLASILICQPHLGSLAEVPQLLNVKLKPVLVWAIAPNERPKLSTGELNSILGTKENEKITLVGNRYYCQKRGDQVYVISKDCPELALMEAQFMLMKEVITLGKEERLPLSSLSAKAIWAFKQSIANTRGLITDEITLDMTQSLKFLARRFVTFRFGEFGERVIVASPMIDEMTPEERDSFTKATTERMMKQFQAREIAKLENKPYVNPEDSAIIGTIRMLDDLTHSVSLSDTRGFRLAVSRSTFKFDLTTQHRKNLDEVYELAKNEHQFTIRQRTHEMHELFRALDPSRFNGRADTAPTEKEVNRYLQSVKFGLEVNNFEGKQIDTMLNRATYASRTDGIVLFAQLRTQDGKIVSHNFDIKF